MAFVYMYCCQRLLELAYLCVLYRPLSVIILVQILSEAPIANNSEVNIFRRIVMGLVNTLMVMGIKASNGVIIENSFWVLYLRTF